MERTCSHSASFAVSAFCHVTKPLRFFVGTDTGMLYSMYKSDTSQAMPKVFNTDKGQWSAFADWQFLSIERTFVIFWKKIFLFKILIGAHFLTEFHWFKIFYQWSEFSDLSKNPPNSNFWAKKFKKNVISLINSSYHSRKIRRSDCNLHKSLWSINSACRPFQRCLISLPYHPVITSYQYPSF